MVDPASTDQPPAPFVPAPPPVVTAPAPPAPARVSAKPGIANINDCAPTADDYPAAAKRADLIASPSLAEVYRPLLASAGLDVHVADERAAARGLQRIALQARLISH